MSDYTDEYLKRLGKYIDPDTAATMTYGAIAQYGYNLMKQRETEKEEALRKSILYDEAFDERMEEAERQDIENYYHMHGRH